MLSRSSGEDADADGGGVLVVVLDVPCSGAEKHRTLLLWLSLTGWMRTAGVWLHVCADAQERATEDPLLLATHFIIVVAGQKQALGWCACL